MSRPVQPGLLRRAARAHLIEGEIAPCLMLIDAARALRNDETAIAERCIARYRATIGPIPGLDAEAA